MPRHNRKQLEKILSPNRKEVMLPNPSFLLSRQWGSLQQEYMRAGAGFYQKLGDPCWRFVKK